MTKQQEYTGSSVSYYSVNISNPTSNREPYIAECNDIIEALKMNFAEGNAFKAIWRKCAAQALGKTKEGYKDGLYDAQKVVFFGQRMVVQATELNKPKETTESWITWEGGENPVPGQKVEFLIRAQKHEDTPVPRSNYSNSLTWRHWARETDIDKYRVVA